MLLPDINVWLALTFESHVHHRSAKTWFDSLATDARCVFCRMTQQGFLRLATNPQAFGEEAVTLSHAWEIYDMLLADIRIDFAEESPGVEAFWRGHTDRNAFSPKVWNDAYLAAFVQASGGILVSFDRGLSQYKDIDCTILS